MDLQFGGFGLRPRGLEDVVISDHENELARVLSVPPRVFSWLKAESERVTVTVTGYFLFQRGREILYTNLVSFYCPM